MQGEAKDGMVKFTIGRPATMHGVKIDNNMGVNTWAAFAGSDDNAVVDGDFAVTEDELQPVLKSLLKEKINIVAIHQHMTHEEPRIMFFHYWGRGPAKDLANAVKGGFLVGGLLQVSSPIAVITTVRKETMKTLSITIMAVTLAGSVAVAETVNFDDMKVGTAPAGWTATQTGSGSAKWAIEKDDSTPSKLNVLKQSGVATFPVCFKNDTSLKDGFVEVKFKPVCGKEDQAGGVIWRLKDANNYYVSRANALEDNVTIYHTINGTPRSLQKHQDKGDFRHVAHVARGFRGE